MCQKEVRNGSQTYLCYLIIIVLQVLCGIGGSKVNGSVYFDLPSSHIFIPYSFIGE